MPLETSKMAQKIDFPRGESNLHPLSPPADYDIRPLGPSRILIGWSFLENWFSPDFYSRFIVKNPNKNGYSNSLDHWSKGRGQRQCTHWKTSVDRKGWSEGFFCPPPMIRMIILLLLLTRSLFIVHNLALSLTLCAYSPLFVCFLFGTAKMKEGLPWPTLLPSFYSLSLQKLGIPPANKWLPSDEGGGENNGEAGALLSSKILLLWMWIVVPEKTTKLFIYFPFFDLKTKKWGREWIYWLIDSDQGGFQDWSDDREWLLGYISWFHSWMIANWIDEERRSTRFFRGNFGEMGSQIKGVGNAKCIILFIMCK